MARPKLAQIPKTTLKFSISTSDTSLTLTSLLDSRGNALAMADFGDLGLCTLAPTVPLSEEIISFTGLTVNSDESVTLTGVTRNLSPQSPYTTLGAGSEHGAGTVVSFSNNPQLYEIILDYIDGVAIAGAPDASLTGKGIVEIATTAEIDADTATGSTGAYIAVTPDQLASSKYGTSEQATSGAISTSAGVSDAGKIIKVNAVGTISSSLLKYYGNGSDGDVTISSPTTLTKDMFYNNLVVTSTLTTAGFKIFVKGQISGAGTIDFGTANTGAAGTASAAGAGGTSTGSGVFRTTAGSAGGIGGGGGQNGVAGTAKTSALGVAGSAGGNSGSGAGGSAITTTGGAGGAVTLPSILIGSNIPFNIAGVDVNTSGSVTPYTSSGGAGGGAGGDHGSGGGTGFGEDPGGGGGGASGGIVFIAAKTWTGTFTIKATGGAGGAGGVATGSWSNGINGAGGGAGGAGGCSVVFYDTKTWTGSYNLAGGAGGAGGAGNNSGGAGSAGTTGSTGVSYEIN